MHSQESSWGTRVSQALNWHSLLLVFCGGFCGTLLRYSMDIIASAYPIKFLHFSWSTWVVNLVGATLLGYLGRTLARLRRQWPSAIPDRLRLLTATGFCGSVTTYGTVAAVGARSLPGHGFLERVSTKSDSWAMPWGSMWGGSQTLPMLTEAIIMVALGLLCAYVGILLGAKRINA